MTHQNWVLKNLYVYQLMGARGRTGTISVQYRYTVKKSWREEAIHTTIPICWCRRLIHLVGRFFLSKIVTPGRNSSNFFLQWGMNVELFITSSVFTVAQKSESTWSGLHSNFQIFREKVTVTRRDWKGPKTISRYCPFKIICWKSSILYCLVPTVHSNFTSLNSLLISGDESANVRGLFPNLFSMHGLALKKDNVIFFVAYR